MSSTDCYVDFGFSGGPVYQNPFDISVIFLNHYVDVVEGVITDGKAVKNIRNISRSVSVVILIIDINE